MKNEPAIKMTKIGVDPKILKTIHDDVNRMAALMPKMSEGTVVAIKKIYDNYARIYSSMPVIPSEVSETLRKMQEDFAKIAQFLPRISIKTLGLGTNLQEKFTETARAMQKMHESWVEPLKPLLNTMEEMSKSMQSMVLSVQKQFGFGFKPEVLEALKESLNINFEEWGKILTSLGWWLFPDLPMPAFKRIIMWYKNGEHNKINEAIIKFYNEKIDDILKEWENNPLLKERIHILEDIIEAHKQEKYTLSVPAMLPQIEWLIVKITNFKGTGYPRMRKQLKDKIIKGRKTAFLIENSLYLATSFLLKVGFQWGTEEKTFGRHPVSHGYLAEYDQEQYSLKLVLLFHYLQKSLMPKKEPS